MGVVRRNTISFMRPKRKYIQAMIWCPDHSIIVSRIALALCSGVDIILLMLIGRCGMGWERRWKGWKGWILPYL
ncbi:hypothetical protein EJ08DRAFT_499028 [Tothia fuscella]|uniref:Uncharacterized protein n=1 Tax=Tothia fuscella TaxID=1048955 RepID=A0A9P4NXL9_9PEZI|nr:hypothetical protein EJ08DRAFT_499028 [Tothia fuscella]